MAQKCGNCHKNCIPNKIQPPALNSLVAAIQPIKQGNAPGKAPIKTAIEFIFLRVYI
jgi:hypothetical protein